MLGEAPEVHYTTVDGRAIAYQVVGEGPIDVAFQPSWFTNVELMWESPTVARFLERLATFSRLVLFDRRGSGLSDSVPAEELTVENRMADAVAVLDAAGSTRVALFAAMHGTTALAPLAAADPDRVKALVVYNGTACVLGADGYPIGAPPEDFDRVVEPVFAHWGRSNLLGQPLTPSQAAWWQRYQRQSIGPTEALHAMKQIARADVRAVLPRITCPTLVIHRSDNTLLPIEHARYLVEHIPDARLLELPGSDPGWMFDAHEPVLDEIQEFLIGSRAELAPARALATVMFTDVVDSTSRAAAIGDTRWRDELDHHDAVVRRHLARHDGRLIKSTGDGVLATFDSPTSALRCGKAIAAETAAAGLSSRVGVHTGEIEWRDQDLTGLTVVIAARVAALASAGEVLTTGTVRDLVLGSGQRFDGAGCHGLKGVPGEWHVWRLT